MADAPEDAALRADPYGSYNFRLMWNDKYVAAFSEASGLFPAAPNKAAGRATPGQSKYEPVTLKRGIVGDAAFERWCRQLWAPASGTDAPEAGAEALEDFRQDLVLHLFGQNGEVAWTFALDRCWPSQLTALGALDTSAGAMAIEYLTLENEGMTAAAVARGGSG